MFEFDEANRGRCHQHKLVIKQSRTRLRQSFFSRRVVGHWNGLPENVTNAASLLSFKNRLDEHFTKKGYGLLIFLGLVLLDERISKYKLRAD